MTKSRTTIGWREQVNLPDIGLLGAVAKIDTGALTSALHVNSAEPFTSADGQPWIRFSFETHAPGGEQIDKIIEAELFDFRKVKSSNGVVEDRYVIKTNLVIGPIAGLVEFTLTNRKYMRYPMLIGRRALRRRFLIDPARSFVLGH